MIPILYALSGFVAFIVIVAMFIIYNSLIVLRNNIGRASADIDVLLKKRADLIPNLINVVKGYSTYEKSVLTQVTKLRTEIMSNQDITDKMQQSNQVSAALKSIFAVAENYPDLKADQNFLQLQQTLSEIETQIADRREFYNDSVNSFNIKIQQVPYDAIANLMKYKPLPFLQITAQEAQPVSTSSLLDNN